MRPRLVFLLLGWFLTLSGNAAEFPEIPYEKFVLRNGLTVVVHEDHKAPIVCIDVWYHVGSKNEKRGHTRLAHLFEHVMFSGSEHIPRPLATALQEIGATQWNGATNEDRTHYYEDVPTSALDYALWLESDRMGYLLSALDQKKLDAQRGWYRTKNGSARVNPTARLPPSLRRIPTRRVIPIRGLCWVRWRIWKAPPSPMFAEAVLNPSFPDAKVKQHQQHQLSVIKGEQNTPYQPH